MAKASLDTPKGYEERAQFCGCSLGRELLTLMERKKTNLAVNPDVTTASQLLQIASAVGPHICILKTHIDLLSDFTPAVTRELRELAKHHHFLIFEDRKFADIGSIAKEQYSGGVYRIADWAQITNAHLLPGPGIIDGLKEAGMPKGNALLLVAEMSSKGSLAQGEYTQQCITAALEYPEFVMGFICQRRLVVDPGFIHLTPGVNLSRGGDSLGQQYRTPEMAILDQGNDIVIVGRGIYEAADPAATAREYRQAAWNAYEKRLEL